MEGHRATRWPYLLSTWVFRGRNLHRIIDTRLRVLAKPFRKTPFKNPRGAFAPRGFLFSARFFNKKAPHFREGLFLSYPTRTRTLNVCTKNRSVAITPSDNSPFRDGKYTSIDKLQKRVTQNFHCLTIICSAEGLDFLIFEPITRIPIYNWLKNTVP